jgi:PTS system mannose-specific IID component/fructoselysine and glucoselysine-specific PTS system IID component
MADTIKHEQNTKPLIGNKELRSMFWRSFLIQSSWSFDKMMAYGQMYGIEKSLRKIYPNDDDYYAALKRHCETFNVTPHISPFIMSLSVAMEEENAKNQNFDVSSINKVKIGLMGPLSGIGDSFFWGTFRVIAAGIGIGIAKQGNILGSILYFLIYTSIHFIAKWLSAKYGYTLGTKFLNQSEESHSIEKLSYGASILGLTVIGAMIGTMVTLQAKLQFDLSGTVTKLQSIFDQIFPGILPLAVTFICLFLLRKNVKVIYVILGIFVFSILGSWAGVF